MTIQPDPPRYRSYLLRCWEERSHLPRGPTVWRFSLQNPHTGERRGFASLEALFAALQSQLEVEDQPPPAETRR